ncbi:MAG: peptide-methionine (S)-S-oxide reductase MsrA [Magnetococcales bacterium]|nr:peptide-methionine (S)-S-oxide reductase MsrA [Magnetococcales bacterium]
MWRSFIMFKKNKAHMVDSSQALVGRNEAMKTPAKHFVNSNPICPPFPEHLSFALFGLGCFWGAERMFWKLAGVYSTAVGYSAGYTPNPTYEEVCSGQTGHNEVVQVIFDPLVISYEQLLKVFWEQHNPTQGMSQGNDVGTQYRSGIYTYNDQQRLAAELTRAEYQKVLLANRLGKITTEIIPATQFYYAEGYHQQYLAKNPGGYCGIGGTGISLPISQDDTSKNPEDKYQVPKINRLLSGKPMDEIIMDPANPNLKNQ